MLFFDDIIKVSCSDMSWVENGDDEESIAFVKGYDLKTKPVVEELIPKYSDKKITFHNREESEKYLKKI